jgi:hypothetical protein
MASEAFLVNASQFLYLLKEDDNNLKVRALERLNSIVDSNWAEISESLSIMSIIILIKIIIEFFV